MHIYHHTVGKHIVCNQTYYKWRLSQCFAFNHYFQRITGLTVYIACRFQTLLGQHRKKGRDGPIWLMLKLDIKEGKKPIGLDLHREQYAGLYGKRYVNNVHMYWGSIEDLHRHLNGIEGV